MVKDNLLELLWEGISQKRCEGSIYDDRATCRRTPVCDCLVTASALEFAISPILGRLVAERDAAREAFTLLHAMGSNVDDIVDRVVNEMHEPCRECAEAITKNVIVPILQCAQ